MLRLSPSRSRSRPAGWVVSVREKKKDLQLVSTPGRVRHLHGCKWPSTKDRKKTPKSLKEIKRDKRSFVCRWKREMGGLRRRRKPKSLVQTWEGKLSLWQKVTRCMNGPCLHYRTRGSFRVTCRLDKTVGLYRDRHFDEAGQ